MHKKVGCLIKYLLRKSKSKKECLEMVKNINYLNSTKKEEGKGVMKKIAKLKMAKNSI